MSANFQQLANFIWSVADLLRGPYRPPQYERVMLPLTVLRRFDAVLASSKEAVLKRHAELSNKGPPPTLRCSSRLSSRMIGHSSARYIVASEHSPSH